VDELGGVGTIALADAIADDRLFGPGHANVNVLIALGENLGSVSV
jgi:hypothetical protein